MPKAKGLKLYFMERYDNILKLLYKIHRTNYNILSLVQQVHKLLHLALGPSSFGFVKIKFNLVSILNLDML